MLGEGAYAIVTRFIEEVVNGGRLPEAHEPVLDESVRRLLTTVRSSFPDLKFTTDGIAIEGDELAVQGTVSGTHQAQFRDIAPTGRRVTIEGTIFLRLDAGKIRDVRFEPKQLNIRQQLLENESDLPWYKQYGGGAWEAEGNRQLGFLKDAGMQPHHHLLDVGCGTLRGGIKLIPYLDTGHYWGVDSNAEALEGGREAIRELHLESKDPHLVHLTDFSFQSLNQDFDFYLAYSVFTEIPLNSIIRCIVNIDRALAPGAKFYATFWENPEGKRNLEPIQYYPKLTTYFDEYPYHYDFETFEWMCEGTGLQVEYLGKWCGRGPQRAMVFTRK
jgi:predicted ester cyclase